MKTSPGTARTQQGYMLLEALISVAIFAVGVLGILSVVAILIKDNSAAEYRTDACLLVNELIGEMWADNRTPATLLNNYQGGIGGTDGAKYVTWRDSIINNNRLPGVTSTVNVPTVTVTTVNGANPPATAKSQVTITVFWQLPGDVQHSYMAVTEIK